MGGGIPDRGFWEGKRVLLTGHTGFKGSWASLWLSQLGAEVHGFSADVYPEPALFSQLHLGDHMEQTIGDVRDPDLVLDVVSRVRPEVVIHMAAQAFVRRSFDEPLATYEINVMGTANVLEAARHVDSSSAVLVITSDKCYDNWEQGHPFVEDDPMGGHDPYSNSKGCAELVTDAFRRSFFSGSSVANVASARAGNVIGGGDWGEDRLVPDIMRAVFAGESVPIRRPAAIRPWQHVLNPVSGYLVLVERLSRSSDYARGWNFGPRREDARPVSYLVDRIGELWPTGIDWNLDQGDHPHEAAFLSLDSSMAARELGWSPRWSLDEGIEATVRWYEALDSGAEMINFTTGQLEEFKAEDAN